MIEIKNLICNIDKKEILDDITLNINNNEITVFLGENGSGKTTLFTSMLDINKKRYQGDIIIDGVNIKDIKSKALAKILTFNFQIKAPTSMYVYEMLKLARSPYKGLNLGLDDSDEEIIIYAIEVCGISELLNQRMNTLSGGERQMVYLAMSIIQDTPYIFFDEPDTYLDALNKKKLFNIIKELNKKGKAIIISLHSIETAFSIADRIIVMKSGKVIGEITKDQFDDETIIESTFNIKKIIINDNDEKIFIFR